MESSTAHQVFDRTLGGMKNTQIGEFDVILAMLMDGRTHTCEANINTGPTPLQSLFDTKYFSISLRKSTPPQNRQLNILISNSEQ